MTFEQAISTLNLYVLSDAGVTRRQATEAIAAIEDAMRLVQQRYADKEAVRLGHILRALATPEQIYAAEAAARLEYPDAWAGRIPTVKREKGTNPVAETTAGAAGLWA